MLNFNEYVELRLDIIDDESYTESETSAMLDALDNNHPEYYEAVCDYDKIQVLREAVEERFLNDELDYEEYAMVIDRLDEKESYLEAKVDDYLISKFKKYLSDTGHNVDNVDNNVESDIKRYVRRIRRLGRSVEYQSKLPKNPQLHRSINYRSDDKLTDKELLRKILNAQKELKQERNNKKITDDNCKRSSKRDKLTDLKKLKDEQLYHAMLKEQKNLLNKFQK